MVFEEGGMILVGGTLGVVSGILPGIHPNLISTVFYRVYETIGLTSENGIALIVAMVMVNTFVNFIASCYLGVADPETCLTLLPGQRMMLEGRAHEAVLLTLVGTLSSVIGVLLLAPVLIKLTPLVFEKIKGVIVFILVGVVVSLIVLERRSKFFAVVTVILSGSLGFFVLRMYDLHEPLLPLLSGLFGLPPLVLGFLQKIEIKEQKIEYGGVGKKVWLKSQGAAMVSGYMFSLLPTLGPSQAALLGSKLFKCSEKGFLMVSSGLNAVNMLVSFITLYTIQKARNGPVVIIEKMIGTLSSRLFLRIVAYVLITVFLATTVTILISRCCARWVRRAKYSRIAAGVILFVLVLVGVMSGWKGLLVVVVAFFVGLVANVSNVQRSHLMASLMLPTILFLSGFQ